MRRLLNLSRYFISTVPKPSRFIFKYGWSIVPHPQKQQKGGEDAVFTSKNVLVVADGVGGWAESGIDPGLYSKRLVKIMEQLLAKQQQKYIENPKQLVNQAVQLNKQTGSTTVCILTLDPNSGLVRSYYLGDSVFAIVNQKQGMISAAPDQQIEFNFPVQVGTNGFSPLEGIYKEFKKGQIDPTSYLVIATDGLWDNMQLGIVFSIATGRVKDIDLKTLDQKAETMALVTRGLYSQMQQFESPFYLKAKEAGLNYPKQGKPDDTSIIIAQIVKQQL